MKTMFYACFRDGYNKETYSNLYHNWKDFYNDTFSPDTEIYVIIPFVVSGKTYGEKKEAARQLAIDFQARHEIGLSYAEYMLIGNYFKKIGKQYGLTAEFKENGII